MAMFDMHGRVAVITGGTAGLGKGMAIALARQGADLAILARRPDKLEEAAADIRTLGVRCLPVVCDISGDDSVQAAVQAVLDEYGKVDILVNNAGNGGPSLPTTEMPQEIFERVVNLDLCSLFRVMKAFGKVMVESGYGRIVNIASAMGMVGNLDVPLVGYQAAKGGVINLTRAAAADWATAGVTVNNICPGMFPSESNGKEFMEGQETFIRRITPMQRAGKPTDLNTVGDMDAAVVFLASEESRYVTGVTLPCDGGWTCV
ncbi:MAG: SDR family oxidoreductase [Lachnospiraceae bacterium]|nr:SDR family oxidoreductase [Lachnospiraceae bacterium]